MSLLQQPITVEKPSHKPRRKGNQLRAVVQGPHHELDSETEPPPSPAKPLQHRTRKTPRTPQFTTPPQTYTKSATPPKRILGGRQEPVPPCPPTPTQRWSNIWGYSSSMATDYGMEPSLDEETDTLLPPSVLILSVILYTLIYLTIRQPCPRRVAQLQIQRVGRCITMSPSGYRTPKSVLGI